MKNIHILPTDKPSSIGYDGVKNLHFVNDFIDDYQNVYITSDEEIKEGDYFYQDFDCIIHKCYKLSDNYVIAEKPSDYPKKICKKIILTTDQDLIQDGVQAIDDEFLEWFVKNPSCETIDVRDIKTIPALQLTGNNHLYYKMIIPKEEPKQCELCKRYPRLEGTNKCESCYSVVRHVLEQDPRFKDNLLPDLRKKQETPSVGVGNQIFKIVLDEKWRPNKVSMIETDNNSILNKQKTLEEVAERLTKDFPHYSVRGNMDDSDIKGWFLEALQKGAKWQQERSYSEEDLKLLLKKFKKDIINSTELDDDFETLVCDIETNKWFEQFKKK